MTFPLPVGGLAEYSKEHVEELIELICDRNCDVRGLPFGFFLVRIVDHGNWESSVITYRMKDNSLLKSRLPSEVFREVYKDRYHPRLFDSEGFFHISTPDLARLLMSDVLFEHKGGFAWTRMEPTHKEFITDLYEQRLIAKAAGQEAKQQGYKIMLNSSFGKLMQKSITEAQVVVPREMDMQTGEWFCKINRREYNEDIGHADDIGGDQVIVTMKSKEGETYSCENESPIQMGAAVLALSRWYMDWCLYRAADFNFEKYEEAANRRAYQDTDSFYQFEQNAKLFEKAGLYNKQLGAFKNEVHPGRIRKFQSPGPKLKCYDVHYPSGEVKTNVNFKGYAGDDAPRMIEDLMTHFEATGKHTSWARNYDAITTHSDVEYTVSENCILKQDTYLKLGSDSETKEVWVWKRYSTFPIQSLEDVRKQWKGVLKAYREKVLEFKNSS